MKQLRKLKVWLPQTKRQRFIYAVTLLFALSIVSIAGFRFLRTSKTGSDQAVAEVIRDLIQGEPGSDAKLFTPHRLSAPLAIPRAFREYWQE